MITLAEGELAKLYGLEESDEDIPEGSVVVGSNGVFQTSSSPIFKIIKPTTKIFSGFKEIKAEAYLTKKIPWSVFWQAPAWLKKQWDERKNQEYIILLFYNPETEEYFWHPPRQDGSPAHLDYSVSEDEDVKKFVEQGCMLAGTMHNHFGSKGSAFQSGTDSHDEARSGATGIHWTMGYMDCKNLFQAEFHVRIVSGVFDKTISMKDCIEDPPNIILPEEWDKKLDLKPISKVANKVEYWRDWYSKGKGRTKNKHYGYGNSYYGEHWYKKYQDGESEDFQPRGSNVMYLPPTTKTDSQKQSGKDSKSKGEKSESVKSVNLSTDGEHILGDITILNHSPEKSDIYNDLIRKYPAISGLANGKELIRCMALTKAIYDGAQYAVYTDEFGEEREDGLEYIIKDMASGTVGIMASLKSFFDKQTDMLEDS